MTHAAARDLLRRGFAVIPLPPREKGPKVRGWPSLRIGEAELDRHFARDANVGILLGEASGWVVDVDLDHELAVAVADSILPHTAATFGRDSRPRSHRLFRVTSEVRTVKHEAAGVGTLVELRSTGCQTMAPGSVHPDGETVRWDDDGDPTEIDPAELVSAVKRLAAAVAGDLGVEPAKPAKKAATKQGTKPVSGRGGAYVAAALRNEVDRVLTATEGARNRELNNAALALGHYVGAGRLERGVVEAELLHAALRCGLPDGEARRTIRSGLEKGISEPKTKRRRASPVQWTPFPTDALPEPARSFVQEASEAFGVDAAFVALPLLAALATAVGGSRCIQLKAGWSEPCILWTMVVAPSGSIKTATLEAATAFVADADRKAREEHETALEGWREEEARAKAARARWEREASKGDPSAGVVAPSIPPQPPCRRLLVGCVTVEKLAPMLAENPRGLLVARDELAGWIGSFDRYAGGRGGSDAASWLSMHSAGRIVVDRKTTGSVYVPSAVVSITGGIQRKTLARAFREEDRENGLLPRFLLGMPPWVSPKWSERTIDAMTQFDMARLTDRLLMLEPEIDGAGRSRPKCVRLGEDARPVWIEFHDRHAEETDGLAGDGDERSAFSKLKGGAARLALLMHMVRFAAEDATLADPDRVDATSMRAGIRLAEWFGSEALRVYADLAVSGEDRDAEELAEFIGSRFPDGVTPSQLAKAKRSLRGDSEAAETMLHDLVERGIGVWSNSTPSPKGGRPTRRFVLKEGGAVTETSL